MQATAERQERKQKRKAEEGKLVAKRQEMDKAKASILTVLMGYTYHHIRLRML